MGLLDQIRVASQRLQQLHDAGTLSRRLGEIVEDVHDLVTRDWSVASMDEQEAVATRIKQAVVGELIPVASAVSMMGVPSLLVYPPCQLAGGLALTRIRTNDFVLRPEYLRALAGILVWNRLGQLACVHLADLLKPLLSAPVVGLALLPFVQRWTLAVLDQVDGRYAASAACVAANAASVRADAANAGRG